MADLNRYVNAKLCYSSNCVKGKCYSPGCINHHLRLTPVTLIPKTQLFGSGHSSAFSNPTSSKPQCVFSASSPSSFANPNSTPNQQQQTLLSPSSRKRPASDLSTLGSLQIVSPTMSPRTSSPENNTTSKRRRGPTTLLISDQPVVVTGPPWLRQLHHHGIIFTDSGDISPHTCLKCGEANPFLSQAILHLSQRNYTTAKQVLEGAYEQNPKADLTWLLQTHAEFKGRGVDAARVVLSNMRTLVMSAQAWLFSAEFEVHVGASAEALHRAREGVGLFGDDEALWILTANIYESGKFLSEAFATYTSAIERLPDSTLLRCGRDALSVSVGN